MKLISEMEGVNEMVNRNDAINAVETIVRFIESTDGELREGLVDTPQRVINSFEETKFVPEALYRVSEIYLSLGMKEESEKNAAILGYNYPNSRWYKFIYF